MKTIGFLNSAAQAAFSDFVAAFQQGLAREGCPVGQNVAIEFRWADGHYDRLAAMASDLVQCDVDVIAATGGIVSAKAALAATKSIPVLFVSGADAVQAGLVDDLQRPGGNATGVQLSTTEALPRRLELLRRLVPRAAKIALLVNPNSFVARMEEADVRRANLVVLRASTASEIDAAFDNAAGQQVGAMLVSADPFFTSQRDHLVARAARANLPTAYPWREYSQAGGLMSQGPSLPDAYREIGAYAGRILNGSRVSELPVKVIGVSDFKVAIKESAARAHNLDVSNLGVR